MRVLELVHLTCINDFKHARSLIFAFCLGFSNLAASLSSSTSQLDPPHHYGPPSHCLNPMTEAEHIVYKDHNSPHSPIIDSCALPLTRLHLHGSFPSSYFPHRHTLLIALHGLFSSFLLFSAQAHTTHRSKAQSPVHTFLWAPCLTTAVCGPIVR